MKYDIIVIGAGSGGLNIAGFMNKAGFKVLMIDKRDESIGGDCLNYGCVPSKALIHVSRLAHDAKEAKKFGISTSGNINLAKVSKFVNEKKEIIRVHENATYFRNKGVDVELGHAKFVSKNSVDVNGKIFTAKKIILATGSRPRKLNILGIENITYLTNETIFNLKKLPKKLVIVGGGPIGIELGQAFQRFGSSVCVIDSGDIFLPKENESIAKVLHKQLVKEGMTFFFNSRPSKIIGKNKIVVKNKEGIETTITFDSLLVSIGRELNMDVNLEKANIKTKNNRIVVDKYLRTTNKKVLLCGDIVGSYQFTHTAELHAGVILNNFFSPKKKKINYDNLSWVTYTSPEIATFGLSAQQLEKRKQKFSTIKNTFKDDDRAIVDDYADGELIVYMHKGKLLGGSMVAMNAGELFQELVLANSAGLDVKDIFAKTYAYPTATRINKSTILKHFAGKLTPFAKKLLKLLY